MSAVSVRILGCGDAFSSGGRRHSSFLLEGGDESVLLDCGATTLGALKESGIASGSIGWLALSHLHGDHFGGLPWLILDGRFSGRTNALTVAGPRSTPERLDQALEALYPGSSSSENPFVLEFLAHSEGSRQQLGPAVLTPYEVVHSSGAPSYALRVEYGDRVIAYSGDTEWTDALIDVAEDADLFLCECNDFEQSVPGHLNLETLRRNRSRLSCRRLVVTHMGEEMLARQDEVEAETAADGMVLEL